MRINWKVWWSMWRFGADTYLVRLRTPWFLLMLSSGDREWDTGRVWFGVQLYCNPVPGWWVIEGERVFRSEDKFLSWPKYDFRRHVSGGR